MRAKYRHTIQSIPARISDLSGLAAGRPCGQQAQSISELRGWDGSGVSDCQLGIEFPATAFAARLAGQLGRVHGHAPYGCAHNDLRSAASRLSGRSGSETLRCARPLLVIYPVGVRNDGGLRKNACANPERYVHRRIREFERPFSASECDHNVDVRSPTTLPQNRESRPTPRASPRHWQARRCVASPDASALGVLRSPLDRLGHSSWAYLPGRNPCSIGNSLESVCDVPRRVWRRSTSRRSLG
jgi:hypothetical protein